MREDVKHRFEVFNKDGRLAFHWHKNKPPRKADFEGLLEEFKANHPALSEKELDTLKDKDPDEMTQAEFTRWREKNSKRQDRGKFRSPRNAGKPV